MQKPQSVFYTVVAVFGPNPNTVAVLMRVAVFAVAVAVILHIVFALGAAVMAAVVGCDAGGQQQGGGRGE